MLAASTFALVHGRSLSLDAFLAAELMRGRAPKTPLNDPGILTSSMRPLARCWGSHVLELASWRGCQDAIPSRDNGRLAASLPAAMIAFLNLTVSRFPSDATSR